MGILGKIKRYFLEKDTIKKNKDLVSIFPFLKVEYSYKESDYKITHLDSVPKGWQKLAMNYFVKIRNVLVANNALNYFKIVDVKEKFGRLRIEYCFLNCPNVEQNKWVESIIKTIKELEQKSWDYCIVCGAESKYQTAGWITPICKDCKLDLENGGTTVIEKEHE